MAELHEAVATGDREEIDTEFGDVLFSLVNYSRFIGVHPEESLQKAIKKFTARFSFIEETLRNNNKDIHETSFREMDRLWNESKNKE